jgi:ATP-dependent Clp protease ATP-binding subunit ClpA
MRGLHRRAGHSSAEPAPVVAELLAVAEEHARALHHDVVGTEHVLLALCARDDPAGRALRQLGLDAVGARDDVLGLARPPAIFDADALGAIGIDLGAVRERAEEAFGDGALERAWRGRTGCGGAALGIAPDLKQALERARRSAVGRDAEPTAGDVAVALVEQPGAIAARILSARRISLQTLRMALAIPR